MEKSHHGAPTATANHAGSRHGYGRIGGMDMVLANRILDQAAAVPAGWVATYGDIAARAGSPSPRLAGRVLAELADESIPWHRIVRADGTAAEHLRTEQGRRLLAEGVQMRNGRVDLTRHRWHP